jgi:hypothetical protein
LPGSIARSREITRVARSYGAKVTDAEVSTLGAWTLILAVYLILVFCVGSLNPRFILPAEPLALLLLLLPLDALWRWWPAQFRHVTARSTA